MNILKPLGRLSTLSVFLLTAVVLTSLADAADSQFVPNISVSEEYTDNIYDSVHVRDQHEEFITRAQPGFSLRYVAPRLNGNLAYNFDYRHYARKTRGDEYTHLLSSSGMLTVVDNFMFIEMSDSYKQVSLDVARDVTNESLYNNQSDQNLGRVSPYMVWRLGLNSTIKTGYRYSNTWYREPTGVNKSEHAAFIDGSHEVIPGFSLTWGYAFASAETSQMGFSKHDVYGGFRYEYADKSFLFGQGGNTWQSFDSGVKVNNLFWNAGITHEYSFATATLETKVQYSEDPLRSSIKETFYSGKLDRKLARGAIGLSSSYSEYEITETGQMDRRKLAFGATGNYEIVDRITASAGMMGERFSIKTAADYPYRFSSNAGLSFAFNNDLSLSFNYTNVAYRDSLSDATNRKDINRVILEVKKSF